LAEGQFPFKPGLEATSASSTKARQFYGLTDFSWRLGADGVNKCFVAASRYVFVNSGWVNLTDLF
jgi:hypothetical protein